MSRPTSRPQRLFVAAPLGAGPRRDLRARLAALPGGRPPGRAVAAERWHWTLRFLGDCPPRQAQAITRAIAGADLGPGFPLGLGAWGAFPAPARARVLWVGPATEAQARALGDLAARIDRLLEPLAPRSRRTPFAAHLTVARLRPPADLRDLLAAHTGPSGPSVPLREVHLLRSHLGHGPPRYERLARAVLSEPHEP